MESRVGVLALDADIEEARQRATESRRRDRDGEVRRAVAGCFLDDLERQDGRRIKGGARTVGLRGAQRSRVALDELSVQSEAASGIALGRERQGQGHGAAFDVVADVGERRRERCRLSPALGVDREAFLVGASRFVVEAAVASEEQRAGAADLLDEPALVMIMPLFLGRDGCDEDEQAEQGDGSLHWGPP